MSDEAPEPFVGFGTKDLGGAGQAGKKVQQDGKVRLLPRWKARLKSPKR